MFNFMKINDPFLGEGTFGQLARFGPERCSVMHTLLMELENGGWKTNVEFKRFVDAYNTVAGTAEKKYLDTAVDVFFQRFRVIMEKHMVAKWTSTEIVQYCLGGDPHHAKEFARWLIHHQNNKDASSSSTSKPVEFSFEKKRVTLGEHHRRYHGDTVLDVNIDLQDSMHFITKNADPIAILKDPFIERNWAHIESLATESNAVNIWDKSSALLFEKYAPFRLDIIFSICIHSSHQQRCENYVQLCGLLSSTGVGEVRRTCRAIINSILHRRFNLWALRHANEKRKKNGKDPVMRLQGAERMTYFQRFAKKFFKKADKAKRFKPELWTSVRDRLSNGSVKASNMERLNRMKQFHESLKKKPKNLKAAQPKGIEQTSSTSGAVKLGIFTHTNNTYLHGTGMSVDGLIDAELEVRCLLGNNVQEESSLLQKRKAIQLHEYTRILAADPNKEVTLAKVIDFQPMSVEMKEFLRLGYQRKLVDKEKAIRASTDEE